MADSLPLPGGLALDTASWEHTPLAVPHLVVQLLASIPQQTARIQALEARMADLEARVPQRSRHADRPPAADPPDAKPTGRPGAQGRPGAKPGHPGHQPALLAPTAVSEVKPSACPCGPTACLDTSPSSTPHVSERPEIPMLVRHVVWSAASCLRCGRVTQAQVPPAAAAGQGPRLTALIGERSGRQRGRRSTGQACCQSVLGVHLSRGTLQRAVHRGSDAIRPPYEGMAAQARAATGHDMDETAW